MITIKLPYTSDYDFTELRKQYSKVVRFAYNRFFENLTDKQIYHLCTNLKNIDLLQVKIVENAISEAKTMYKKYDGRKVIFGGRKNFYNRIESKITKEEFQKNRISNLCIVGNSKAKGNQMFFLDFIENNRLIFKLNKNEHYEINVPKLKNQHKEYLHKLEILNRVNVRQNGYTYTVKISFTHIYISFKPFLKEPRPILNPNKYLGIDLNPAHIGLSIFDKDRIVHTQEFDLSKLINNITNHKGSSSCKKSKHLNNKLNFETLEISKKIAQLAQYHKTKNVFVEDLNFKTSAKSKGSRFNRLTKNLWKRDKFVQNLQKRLDELGITLTFVNPAYTSVIGNLQHNFTDPVNASAEIARRGFQHYYKKIKDSFYPKLEVKHYWFETVTSNGIKNWKELSDELKKSKLKYRVSLEDCRNFYNPKVFEQTSHKSLVSCYTFKNQVSS